MSLRVLHILDHSLPLQSGYSFRTVSILREQRALGWETHHLTTPKQGQFGPDLTHLMSRETLAAGAVPNTTDNLRLWVRDPQKIKVGCLMPNMQLTDEEVDQVVAYLQTLK